MLALLLATAATAQCAVPPDERMRQLRSTYEQFDSRPGRHGWRQLSAGGCVGEAVKLLADYSSTNAGRLNRSERSEIAFHQGQVLAFAGRDTEALPHFQRAFEIGGTEEWTTYVAATIAFLRRDSVALSKARGRYAEIAPGSMRLTVIDGFVKCAARDYAHAVHCAM
jgi:hypothetical protein